MADSEFAEMKTVPHRPEVPPALHERVYEPLSRWWNRLLETRTKTQPLIVSVSGLPGTGKSTLVEACSALLAARYGRKACGFSLDDVYLTKAARRHLSETVHPLLETRGVPGTHDLDLAFDTLERLLSLVDGEKLALPRFDKLRDDRVPQATWPMVCGRPDIVFLDGWFWGTVPHFDPPLFPALNVREAREDPDGAYRTYVRNALAGRYQELFARSELHVHLQAPNHEASVRWRIEQGRNDAAASGLDPARVDPERIRNFLELFERVGTWPRVKRNEVVVQLGDDHLPLDVAVPADMAEEWVPTTPIPRNPP